MTKDNTQRLLSAPELAKRIAALRARYTVDDAITRSRAILADCIESLDNRIAIQTAYNADPRRFYFFRARPASTFTSLDEITDPRQFTYPPPAIATGIGRAHLPGHPVFYGADSPDGAVEEVYQPGQSEYYLSVWYSEPISLERLNVSYASNITSPRLIKQFNIAVDDLSRQYPKHSKYVHDRMADLLRAWSDLFISEDYPLTASIAHENMYGGFKRYDALVYGSAINGWGVNYAVHPRLADQLNLHKVYSVIRTTPSSLIAYVQCAEIGASGRLEWRQGTVNDLPENDPFLPTTIEK